MVVVVLYANRKMYQIKIAPIFQRQFHIISQYVQQSKQERASFKRCHFHANHTYKTQKSEKDHIISISHQPRLCCKTAGHQMFHSLTRTCYYLLSSTASITGKTLITSCCRTNSKRCITANTSPTKLRILTTGQIFPILYRG